MSLMMEQESELVLKPRLVVSGKTAAGFQAPRCQGEEMGLAKGHVLKGRFFLWILGATFCGASSIRHWRKL